MKSILATVIALGLAVSRVFAQGPTINTPADVIPCQTTLISWTNNGNNPFYLTITLASDPSGATVLSTFPPTNATMVSWYVDIAQETNIVLNIKDSVGNIGQSAMIPIGKNVGNTTCVGSTSFAFGGTDALGATTQGPAAATTTVPSTGNTATTNAGSSAAAPSGSSGGSTATATRSSSTTTRSSSTTTPSSGAYRVTGQIATAGLIGAAMVALLV